MLSGPVTLMGWFLRAMVRKDREARERLRAELVRTEWEGASAVLTGAFQEAVRVKFPPGTKPRELTKFAYRMVRHFGSKELSISDAETLLRWAMGEDVALDRVPGKEAEAIKSLVLIAVVEDRRLNDNEIDELLMRAERLAYTAGYRPTLANPG